MLAGVSACLVCAAVWGLFTLIAVHMMAEIHLTETAFGWQTGGGSLPHAFRLVWTVCSLLLSGLSASALIWMHLSLRRMERASAGRSWSADLIGSDRRSKSLFVRAS